MSAAVSPAPPWRRTATGLHLAVRLTPKGGRDALDGVKILADGAAVILARVRAAPEDGRANAALIALVADAAGVPKSAVRLVAGDKARVKQLALEGDPALLEAKLMNAPGLA